MKKLWIRVITYAFVYYMMAYVGYYSLSKVFELLHIDTLWEYVGSAIAGIFTAILYLVNDNFILASIFKIITLIGLGFHNLFLKVTFTSIASSALRTKVSDPVKRHAMEKFLEEKNRRNLAASAILRHLVAKEPPLSTGIDLVEENWLFFTMKKERAKRIKEKVPNFFTKVHKKVERLTKWIVASSITGIFLLVAAFSPSWVEKLLQYGPIQKQLIGWSGIAYTRRAAEAVHEWVHEPTIHSYFSRLEDFLNLSVDQSSNWMSKEWKSYWDHQKRVLETLRHF